MPRTIRRTNGPGPGPWRGARLTPWPYGGGGDEDGYRGRRCFCTLRCGYRFGPALALGGRRLAPYDEAREGRKEA
jgi:hypothetical protein